MAVALPYLDEAVIAHARGLPSPRAWLSLDKPHLRRQARWDLPDDVVSRAKNPRRRPNIEWLLSDPLPEPVAEAFAPAALRLTGWFDPVGIHHALQQVRARPRHPLNRLRAQLLLIAAGVQRLALR